MDVKPAKEGAKESLMENPEQRKNITDLPLELQSIIGSKLPDQVLFSLIKTPLHSSLRNVALREIFERSSERCRHYQKRHLDYHFKQNSSLHETTESFCYVKGFKNEVLSLPLRTLFLRARMQAEPIKDPIKNELTLYLMTLLAQQGPSFQHLISFFLTHTTDLPKREEKFENLLKFLFDPNASLITLQRSLLAMKIFPKEVVQKYQDQLFKALNTLSHDSRFFFSRGRGGKYLLQTKRALKAQGLGLFYNALSSTQQVSALEELHALSHDDTVSVQIQAGAALIQLIHQVSPPHIFSILDIFKKFSTNTFNKSHRPLRQISAKGICSIFNHLSRKEKMVAISVLSRLCDDLDCKVKKAAKKSLATLYTACSPNDQKKIFDQLYEGCVALHPSIRVNEFHAAGLAAIHSQLSQKESNRFLEFLFCSHVQFMRKKYESTSQNGTFPSFKIATDFGFDNGESKASQFQNLQISFLIEIFENLKRSDRNRVFQKLHDAFFDESQHLQSTASVGISTIYVHLSPSQKKKAFGILHAADSPQVATIASLLSPQQALLAFNKLYNRVESPQPDLFNRKECLPRALSKIYARLPDQQRNPVLKRLYTDIKTNGDPDRTMFNIQILAEMSEHFKGKDATKASKIFYGLLVNLHHPISFGNEIIAPFVIQGVSNTFSFLSTVQQTIAFKRLILMYGNQGLYIKIAVLQALTLLYDRMSEESARLTFDIFLSGCENRCTKIQKVAMEGFIKIHVFLPPSDQLNVLEKLTRLSGSDDDLKLQKLAAHTLMVLINQLLKKSGSNLESLSKILKYLSNSAFEDKVENSPFSPKLSMGSWIRELRDDYLLQINGLNSCAPIKSRTPSNQF